MIEHIDKIKDRDKRQKKLEQIKARINIGFYYITKLSNYVLILPLLFSTLTNSIRFLSLVRVIIHIIQGRKS